MRGTLRGWSRKKRDDSHFPEIAGGAVSTVGFRAVSGCGITVGSCVPGGWYLRGARRGRRGARSGERGARSAGRRARSAGGVGGHAVDLAENFCFSDEGLAGLGFAAQKFLAKSIR